MTRRLNKAEKERLAVDPFFCFGRVDPRELGWDWRGQFAEIALKNLKNCEPFVPMDVGKILGLANYASELEGFVRALAVNEGVPAKQREAAMKLLTGGFA
jgi:hypothetical protein